MSLTFSLQKSATLLFLVFMEAAGSFLSTSFLPQTAIASPGASSHPLIASADSSTNPGIPEKLGGAGIVLVSAIGAGAVGVALTARKDREPSKLGFTSQSMSSKENSLRIEQASRKLQKKLLRLMHDDHNTANRLLAQVKAKNPYKSVDWCVEKVIYDLERDRGGY